VRVLGAARVGGGWMISAGQAFGTECGERSTLWHGWRNRRLQDLPVQGMAVTVNLRMSRRRCRNGDCEHLTFADQLPEIASPHASPTRRVAELIQLFGEDRIISIGLFFS